MGPLPGQINTRALTSSGKPAPLPSFCHKMTAQRPKALLEAARFAGDTVFT